MKAYKGTTKDLTCLGKQYEPGVTYEEDSAGQADQARRAVHAARRQGGVRMSGTVRAHRPPANPVDRDPEPLTPVERVTAHAEWIEAQR